MRIWLFLLGFLFVLPVQADSGRLKSLYQQVRCPVCDGQSLVDSEATLAQDMRYVIYTLVEEGKSDNEIKGFLIERYGERVLNLPESHWENVALWGGALLVLLVLVGSCASLFRFKRQRQT